MTYPCTVEPFCAARRFNVEDLVMTESAFAPGSYISPLNTDTLSFFRLTVPVLLGLIVFIYFVGNLVVFKCNLDVLGFFSQDYQRTDRRTQFEHFKEFISDSFQIALKNHRICNLHSMYNLTLEMHLFAQVLNLKLHLE